jgi:hypothetical protein
MNRSKPLLLALLVIAVVVALEEWRIAGLRSRNARLSDELAEALAAIPPPPRPVPAGEPQSEAMRRTKERIIKEVARETTAARLVAATDEPTDETPAEPTPVVAAAEPPPAEVAAVATPADPPPAVPEEESEEVPGAELPAADPQLKEIVKATYGNLIQTFQFDQAEADYFVDLLAGSIAAQQQLALELVNATTDEQRLAVQQRAETTAQELAERVREFLADETDFATFVQFQQQLDQAASEPAAAGAGG